MNISPFDQDALNALIDRFNSAARGDASARRFALLVDRGAVGNLPVPKGRHRRALIVQFDGLDGAAPLLEVADAIRDFDPEEVAIITCGEALRDTERWDEETEPRLFALCPGAEISVFCDAEGMRA